MMFLPKIFKGTSHERTPLNNLKIPGKQEAKTFAENINFTKYLFNNVCIRKKVFYRKSALKIFDFMDWKCCSLKLDWLMKHERIIIKGTYD